MWSYPRAEMPQTTGWGTQLVASRRPPRPTSRIATSTFSARNTRKAARATTQNYVQQASCDFQRRFTAKQVRMHVYWPSTRYTSAGWNAKSMQRKQIKTATTQAV